MNLKNRILQQLIDLLKLDEYIPYSHFTEKYNISERTLRNDLSTIDGWLVKNKLPMLQRNKFEGIYLDLTPIIKNRLINEFSDYSLDMYIKSPKERAIFIMVELFFNKHMVISELTQKLNISRNTILKDMVWIEDYAKDFNCKLEKKQKVGISIEGSEYNIRNMYIDLMINHCKLDRWDVYANEMINEKYDFFYKKMLNRMFSFVDRQEMISMVEKLEDELSLKYADRSKYIIMASVAITKARCETQSPISFNKILLYETLKLSKEYRILEEILKDRFFKYKGYKKEIAYISLYLLTKKVLDGNIESEGFNDLKHMVENMIDIMEEHIDTKINKREKLIKGLVLHLEPAIYRMKYGITVENPLTSHIREKYERAYNAAKLACSYLGEKLAIEIPTEEICYVAIHFGSALEIQNRNKDVRVVLVCSSGISTVRILEKSLKENFHDFKIVDILSYFEYKKQKNYISDTIISTIPIKDEDSNFIKVNPFLSKEDIKKLSSVLRRKKETAKEEKRVDPKEILEAVKRYANIYDEGKLMEEINFIVNGMKRPSLVEILKKEDFQIVDGVKDWEEGVETASKPLLDQGIIEERYIEVMKGNIKRLNAYVVIKKGVAIPHGKPEDGAKKLGFGLLILKNGVNFNHKKNDPVRLILVTSSVDRIGHLKALEEFLDIIRDEKDLQKILKVKDYGGFCETVDKILSKKKRGGK